MTSVEKDKFATKLIKARRAAGYSQSELGRATRLDPSYISHLESGRRYPNVRNLRSLCMVLGVSSDWLLSIRVRKK